MKNPSKKGGGSPSFLAKTFENNDEAVTLK